MNENNKDGIPARRKLAPTSSRRSSNRRASNIISLNGNNSSSTKGSFVKRLTRQTLLALGDRKLSSLATIPAFSPSATILNLKTLSNLYANSTNTVQKEVKNVLVIGPQSSGKTLFLRALSRMCDVCSANRLKRPLSDKIFGVNNFSLVPIRLDTIPTTGVEFVSCIYNQNGKLQLSKDDGTVGGGSDSNESTKGSSPANNFENSGNNEKTKIISVNTATSLCFQEVGSSLSSMWSTYFERSDMIVFVLDMSNFSKMSETHCQLDLLFETLQEVKKIKADERDSEIIERERPKPVAIILNKSDLASSTMISEIKDFLRLEDICAEYIRSSQEELNCSPRMGESDSIINVYRVSSSTGSNIEHCLHAITQMLL